MRRRSFLGAIASLPLLGNMPPYFRIKPKITAVSVQTDLHFETIYTSMDVSKWEPPSPPIISIIVDYDDGSIRRFECEQSDHSFYYSLDDTTSGCEIEGNNIVVTMAYKKEGNRTPIVMCVYKDVKEVFIGD